MGNFTKTVMVVTVFSITEKILGFLYRIYLSRTIGAEGMGIYQVALSVFALLLTISASGTPITVSRLITKYRAENKTEKIHKVISSGLFVTFIISSVLALVFFIFNNSLDFLFTDKHCSDLFLIVLPGLIFTSLYSVLRGVFWGDKDFLPYSIIELIEEICMIIIGIILINGASDIYDGTYKAGVAVLVSYITSFSLATIVFFMRKHSLKNPVSQLKPLINSAMPITAMRTANSLAMSLVSIILPMRLVESGISKSLAYSMFGSAMGQALPILFVPTTLIGSFTLVLVPEISENFYKRKDFYLKRDIEKAIKFTTVLTCLFIPVFFVCGEEIGMIVFNGHECGKYLTVSSFLMIFMSLSGITTSMLNSMGLENKTLIYFLISGILMLLCIWFLPAYIGIYALLVGFSCVYIISTVLNIILLNKTSPQKPHYIRFVTGCTFLTLPTIILGLMTEKLLLSYLGTFLTLVVSALIMVIFYSALAIGLNLLSIDGVITKLRIKKCTRES